MRRAAALVALGLAVAGCGDGTVLVEATPAAVAAAGQATLEAGTARIEMTSTVQAMGHTVDVAAEGVVDFVNGRSELTFDLASIVGSLGGDALPDEAARFFEGEMRAVTDGSSLYLCAPLFAMLGGSDCIQQDVPGAEGGLAFGGQLADPAAALQSLSGAEDVEEVGTEEVDGVTTTHFRGAGTMASALARLDGAEADELRQHLDEGGVSLDSPFSFEIWVDADGLVRKMTTTTSVAGDQPFEVSGEVRFLDFGTPVDIDVPTDATPMSELQGLLGG